MGKFSGRFATRRKWIMEEAWLDIQRFTSVTDLKHNRNAFNIRRALLRQREKASGGSKCPSFQDVFSWSLCAPQMCICVELGSTSSKPDSGFRDAPVRDRLFRHSRSESQGFVSQSNTTRQSPNETKCTESRAVGAISARAYRGTCGQGCCLPPEWGTHELRKSQRETSINREWLDPLVPEKKGLKLVRC